MKCDRVRPIISHSPIQPLVVPAQAGTPRLCTAKIKSPSSARWAPSPALQEKEMPTSEARNPLDSHTPGKTSPEYREFSRLLDKLDAACPVQFP
jgi:hypothetical protein